MEGAGVSGWPQVQCNKYSGRRDGIVYVVSHRAAAMWLRGDSSVSRMDLQHKCVCVCVRILFFLFLIYPLLSVL